jgi:hypothetical protein
VGVTAYRRIGVTAYGRVRIEQLRGRTGTMGQSHKSHESHRSHSVAGPHVFDLRPHADTPTRRYASLAPSAASPFRAIYNDPLWVWACLGRPSILLSRHVS